jgi:hypothetical protein
MPIYNEFKYVKIYAQYYMRRNKSHSFLKKLAICAMVTSTPSEPADRGFESRQGVRLRTADVAKLTCIVVCT